jgi:hypothetical protein
MEDSQIPDMLRSGPSVDSRTILYPVDPRALARRREEGGLLNRLRPNEDRKEQQDEGRGTD